VSSFRLSFAVSVSYYPCLSRHLLRKMAALPLLFLLKDSSPEMPPVGIRNGLGLPNTKVSGEED